MCDVLSTFNPLQNTDELSQLNACYEIRFALARMYKNIQLINRGVNAKQIFVSNTNLLQVAVSEYQDASLWTYIASVNDIVDPFITTPRYLMIPPKPSTNMSFGA